MHSYFDFCDVENSILELSKQYPFLKVETIGNSHCERKIYNCIIGNNENAVLFCGAFHGLEWLTSALLLKFLKNMCEHIEQQKNFYGINFNSFLQKRGLFVVPCVNPDGINISIHGAKSAKNLKNLVNKMSCGYTKSWQANACGIDLNHNFDAGWQELKQKELDAGVVKPGPTRFGGFSPNSEPEVISLINLCNKVNFSHVLAFHSQGEEIYWNYGKNTPHKSYLIAQILGELSGYTVSAPEGLAVGGGFKDWFIENFNRPGFTIEIGKGKNPLPLHNLESIYRTLEKALVFSCVL